jgi:diguanylate cyclase (GGDEF)-like protein
MLPRTKPKTRSITPSKTPAKSKISTTAASASRPEAPSKVSALARAKLRISTLTAELAAAQARIGELQASVHTDFLLGISNRRGFERELDRALAYIRRYGATGALIVLDVDRLKPINDRFGHAAGDIVLKGVAGVLTGHVRASDVVGRLGGDEFGLLLWHLTEVDARAKATVLEDAIDRLTLAFEGHSVAVGASAGVASLAASDDVAGALERADRAMYARKAARRSSADDTVTDRRGVGRSGVRR